MPKNKDALSRYRIIDNYLRQTPYGKTSRLAEVCSEKLGIPISQRTIQKDIVDMIEDTALQWYAPIKYDHRKKAYFYPNDVEEIFPAIELNDQEISALLFYGQIQDQYHQFGIFNEITEAIDKVLNAANVRKEYREIFKGQPLIQTEKTPPIKGSELLLKIMQGLKAKKKIRFTYHKFEEEKQEIIISPYLLKEEKHFWYVIGAEKETLKTYAVDRMSNLRIVNEAIYKMSFNPKAHFKYSFGVTVPDLQPLEVILSFTPFQGNYLKALPIHETQKILLDNSDEFRISILVKPAYEFYSKILSYGPSVKVVSPDSVVNELKEMLVETLSEYKT